jgi:hypothetical protein
MEEINRGLVRYSQRSIEATFSRHIPVDAWADALPYNLPLEVASVDDGEFVSLDNRRLYSAKNYSDFETVHCVVYQLAGTPADLMRDHGLDRLEIVWVDEANLLNRLSLLANTIEGVVMIRCATQDSTFPILGRLQPDPNRGPRTFDPQTWRIRPANLHFAVCVDPHEESLGAANIVYHQRNDLRDIILGRPDLFAVERYERCSLNFTLQARSEKDSDVWDDWDELLTGLSEAESRTRDEYEVEFFKSRENFC